MPALKQNIPGILQCYANLALRTLYEYSTTKHVEDQTKSTVCGIEMSIFRCLSKTSIHFSKPGRSRACKTLKERSVITLITKVKQAGDVGNREF